MKTLLILRHAKSSWQQTYSGDHDRPLNPRGKQDAPKMGELIRAEDLTPDIILSSTARRAKTTAQLVAAACGFPPDQIRCIPDFYHGEPADYIAALQTLAPEFEVVMVVGHNPGLEYLLEWFTGEEEVLPTAALAQVRFDLANWQQLTTETEGRLIQLWRPRSLN